ncbi:MAG: RNA 2',3'-cyclic phosphodiesterase [Candidatus Diapherotrites archaeon]
MQKRIFFAINIPSEIKNEIFSKISSEIPENKMNLVKAENIHFTILFLGYFSEESIEELKVKLQQFEFKKFKIKISGVGQFNGKIIWLDVEEGGDEMQKLNSELIKLLQISDNKFSTHATIARNKFLGRNTINELIEKLKQNNFTAEFEAETLDLMESVLSEKGSDYKKLLSWH